jgi:Rod binding domain-containing protein
MGPLSATTGLDLTYAARPDARVPTAADSVATAREAAESFEAMVVATLLQPLFSALETDGLGGGGAGEAAFRPMLVDEYAKGIAAAGGIGIADQVLAELLRAQGLTTDGEPLGMALPNVLPGTGTIR